jgi:hypothetical protein
MRGDLVRQLMWVIWPAFLVASLAEVIVFAFIDPFELSLFGIPLNLGREAIYAIGFFGFWGLGIASSALRLFLERSAREVNRDSLAGGSHPAADPRTRDRDPGPDNDAGDCA